MAVDFSLYLDLSASPRPIKTVDRSKFKKKKTGDISFDYCIGARGETSSLTEVVTKETYFNPNDYIINTNDDMVMCALLYGSPLY